MDPLTGFLALTVTVFSSFPLIRKLFGDEDIFTVLVISFIFGLSVILLPLYIVGIILGYGFVATSWIIFLISTVFFLVNATKFFPKALGYIGKLKNILKDAGKSPLDCFFVAAIVFFIFKYSYILSIKGIFDYDAISLYLPFGRRIYEADSIPLTGYDYEPVMRPVGISVLYAWINSLSGSAYNENFRLFPLLFVVVTMLIIYTLGMRVGSKKIAKIAVIVYTFLPLHDAVWFYASYYPDLLYNVLVLATFFFMYKYVTKSKTMYCLFGGISLGLSALMKLQAAYFLPATLFVFASLLKNRYLRSIAIYLLSLSVGYLFILFVWPDSSFFSSLPIASQILASLFIFSATTLVAIAAQYQLSTLQTKSCTTLRLLKSALVFYVTTALIASFWFLRNYFLTGSLVWSIRVDVPSYQWALDFLYPVLEPVPLVNIGTYLFTLILIPFTVYVLGIWIVPMLVGVTRKTKIQNRSLLMIIWMTGYWIAYFWFTFHHFEVFYASVNERDFYAFAPFFSFFAAFGINYIAKYFTKNHDEALIFGLLGSLGFVSLSQSLFLYHYGPTLIRGAFDYIARLFGSPLRALVWQLPQENMLSFLPRILYFILVINILIFSIPFFIRSRTIKWHIKVKLKLNTPFIDWSRKIIPIALGFSLLVSPYLWLTYEFSGGNIQAFGENQLKPIHGGLFTDVAPYLEHHVEDGDVIFMDEFLGLQYHLNKNVRVVALNVPGNLGALREIIESNDSGRILSSLREFGTRYFLLSKGRTQFTDYLSNKSILLDIVRDPNYFQLISFRHWALYELIQGRKSVVISWKDDSFTSNWSYSEYYSTKNANWSFVSDGDVLTVTVSGNSKVEFQYLGLPSLNTTEYQYVAGRVKGSPNARWLFRLFSSKTTNLNYDFPSWTTPSENWNFYVFCVTETLLENQLLDKQAFLAVESVDGNPATISVDFYFVFKYETMKLSD